MEFYTYRIVDDRESDNSTQAEPVQEGEPNGVNPTKAKSKGANHSLMSLATFQKIGGLATSFGGNHIATYMGSTAAQNRFNAGAELAGTAVSIMENPVAGLAMLALSTAKKAMEIAEAKRQDNAQTSETRKRAGASFNTSRL